MKNRIIKIVGSTFCFMVMTGSIFTVEAEAYSEALAISSFLNYIVDFFEKIAVALFI